MRKLRGVGGGGGVSSARGVFSTGGGYFPWGYFPQGGVFSGLVKHRARHIDGQNKF